MMRPVTRWATRSPISRSGDTTWWAPTRSRIRAWGSLMALAQMFGMPRSLSAATVSTLASMPGADADHRTREVGGTELARAPVGSVASASTVWVEHAGCARCTRAGSVSTPSTSWPSATSWIGEGGAEAAEADDDHGVVGGRCPPAGPGGGAAEATESQPTIGLSWGNR